MLQPGEFYGLIYLYFQSKLGDVKIILKQKILLDIGSLNPDS